MADIYLRWDVDYTLRFAEAAADVNLKWIEEAIALDDYAGMARLVREIDSTWIVPANTNLPDTDFASCCAGKPLT